MHATEMRDRCLPECHAWLKCMWTRRIGIMDPHARLEADGKAHAVCMEESSMLDGHGISDGSVGSVICPSRMLYTGMLHYGSLAAVWVVQPAKCITLQPVYHTPSNPLSAWHDCLQCAASMAL